MRNDITRACLGVKTDPDAGTFQAVYCFDEGTTVFEGHFPDYPLVPGVVQLGMVVHALGKATGKAWKLAEVKRAKFSGQALPGQELRVSGKWAQEDGRAAVQASIESDAGKVATMSLSAVEG